MDVQSIATATLLLPAAILGFVAWRARQQGRTDFGLRFRDGGAGELVRGAGWGLVTAAVFAVVFVVTRLVHVDGWAGGWAGWAGIAVYFAILFLVEELIFRGALLTGLRVVATRSPARSGVDTGLVLAIVITSVLVALPYSFSPGTSVLALAGAVLTNAVQAVARWRTGRIWFGLGWRWVLNIAFLALGMPDAGYSLPTPLVDIHQTSSSWLAGGSFGPEAGIVGIAIEAVVLVLIWRYARGSRGHGSSARPTGGPVPVAGQVHRHGSADLVRQERRGPQPVVQPGPGLVGQVQGRLVQGGPASFVPEGPGIDVEQPDPPAPPVVDAR